MTKRRYLFLLALLFCAILAVGLYLGRRGPIPPVVILPLVEPRPSRYKIVAEQVRWWLRFHLFGPGKDILINATVIKFASPFIGSNLPLPQVIFSNSTGLSVWFLSDRELRAVRRAIPQFPGAEIVSNPRIQTASGMAGSMFIGETVSINGTNQNVGLDFNILPRLREHAIELTSRLTLTEVVTRPVLETDAVSVSPRNLTNCDVRSRIQVPNGSAVFVVNVAPETNSKSIGVLIAPALR